MKRLENKHIWLVIDSETFFYSGERAEKLIIRGGAKNHLCPMISTKPHEDTGKVWEEIEHIFTENTPLSDIAKLISERGIKGHLFEEI